MKTTYTTTGRVPVIWWNKYIQRTKETGEKRSTILETAINILEELPDGYGKKLEMKNIKITTNDKTLMEKFIKECKRVEIQESTAIRYTLEGILSGVL